VDVPKKKSPSTGKPTPALGKNDVPYIKMKSEYSDLMQLFICREELKSNIALRRAEKLIQAVQNRPNDDKKLPVPLVYYQAHTGRYGGNEGLNLQNLQRGSTHRLSLTAPENYLVYVADSSNIEARMLAWLAGETALVQQFAAGIDTYATLASDIYGFTVDKKKNPGERGVGKVARLGLGYGMGAKTFQKTLESGPMGMEPIPCTFEFAEKVVKTYRRTNPAIPQLWKTAQRMLEDMQRKDCNLVWGPMRVIHQCICLPNGMYLQFPNLQTKEIQTAKGYEYETVYYTFSRASKKWEERKIYGGKLVENICQALAGIVIRQQMLKIDQIMQEKYKGSVVLQVHDENIVIAEDGGIQLLGTNEWGDKIWSNAEKADEIMQSMYDVMNQAPSWAKGLPLDSEGGYDRCYSK
jgi:DNA polymerase